jgi:hypothetical protein
VHLLGCITQRSPGPVQEPVSNQFEAISNLSTAFSFLQAEGVKLVNVAPPDIERVGSRCWPCAV